MRPYYMLDQSDTMYGYHECMYMGDIHEALKVRYEPLCTTIHTYELAVYICTL